MTSGEVATSLPLEIRDERGRCDAWSGPARGERYDHVRGSSDLAPYLPRAEAWLSNLGSNRPPQGKTRRLRVLGAGRAARIDKASESASFERLPPAASARRAPWPLVWSSTRPAQWRWLRLALLPVRCRGPALRLLRRGRSARRRWARRRVGGAGRAPTGGPQRGACVVGLPGRAGAGAAPPGRWARHRCGRRRITLRWRGFPNDRSVRRPGRVRIVAGVSTSAAPLDWSAAILRVVAIPAQHAVARTTRFGGWRWYHPSCSSWASPGGEPIRIARTLVSSHGEETGVRDASPSARSRHEPPGTEPARGRDDTAADELRGQLGIPAPRASSGSLLGSEVMVASSADAEELRRLLGISQLPSSGRGTITVNEDAPGADMASEAPSRPRHRSARPTGARRTLVVGADLDGARAS